MYWLKTHMPYKTPATMALPDIALPEPRISKPLIPFLRIPARLYILFSYGAARIALLGEKVLFETFKRALAGESRCIIAFRHSNGGEPQLLSWYFLYRLKANAARKGMRFVRRPHAVFVYGYEVARWGGFLARFALPRLGALPVHHAKMDSRGMDRIYNAIVEGPYPLALAPEGQVSYTSNAVPRLEPGVMRIGFTAARRIEEKGSGCPVEVLPLSIHLRYGRRGRAAMEKLLGKIERLAGFSLRSRKELPFVERLRQCRERILEVNEARYHIEADPSFSFEGRLDRVIAAALETAERTLGLKSEGELFPRMYRLRQICWDRIILPGINSLKDMPPVDRGAADLLAGEAWHIGRHQELVDFCWYFRVPLPAEDAALHDQVEYVQNLWDFANRTMGGAFADRITIAPRKIIIHAEPVINLTGRLSSYQKDKKAAVAQALADLEKAYLNSVNEINRLEPGG
jgi:1-acyl-sn-glycerol-3-phosphate acyltransferase